MAFPNSPVDGQVYNDYIFNATKQVWEINQSTFDEVIDTNGIIVSGGSALTFEDGKHRITNNDGGGNFNIRIGHEFNGTNNVSTENGYACFIGHKVKGRGKTYRKSIKGIPGLGNKILYIVGDVFPSISFMKTRYGVKSNIIVLLFYPLRIGKLLLLFMR